MDRCPFCGGDDLRSLGILESGPVVECLGCGKMWRDGDDEMLVRSRVLCELATEGPTGKEADEGSGGNSDE